MRVTPSLPQRGRQPRGASPLDPRSWKIMLLFISPCWFQRYYQFYRRPEEGSRDNLKSRFSRPCSGPAVPRSGPASGEPSYFQWLCFGREHSFMRLSAEKSECLVSGNCQKIHPVSRSVRRSASPNSCVPVLPPRSRVRIPFPRTCRIPVSIRRAPALSPT